MRQLGDMDLMELLNIIHQNNFNLTAAAEKLGVDRKTLRTELQIRGQYKTIKEMMRLKNTRRPKHDLAPPDIRVLETLKALKYPIELRELSGRVNVEPNDIRKICRQLEEKGYDIKHVDKGNDSMYTLVRYGTLSTKNLYRPLGHFELPAIFTSDWHMGSYGFSETAWDALLKDCEEFGINSIVAPGDLLQGRGVHRLELQDVSIFQIDKQIDFLCEHLKQLEDIGVHVHCVIGNHEEKLKGNVNVGFDALKAASRKADNMTYYGHVAKLNIGSPNSDDSLLMMHSHGGITYAISYRAQRIFAELYEKPNILAMGHSHRMLVTPLGPVNTEVECGTLQRENSFLLNRGHMSIIGWYVMHDYNNERIVFTQRRPAVW